MIVISSSSSSSLMIVIFFLVNDCYLFFLFFRFFFFLLFCFFLLILIPLLRLLLLIVDEMFLDRLLRQPRFSKLRALSLEGCSALKSLVPVSQYCRELKVLLLTDCRSLTPSAILDCVSRLRLDRLELYRASRKWALVRDVLLIKPDIKLGMFWMVSEGSNLLSLLLVVCCLLLLLFVVVVVCSFSSSSSFSYFLLAAYCHCAVLLC